MGEQARSRLADTRALRDPRVPLVVLDLRSVETYLLAQPLTWLAVERDGAIWCPLASEPAPLDLDRETARCLAERLRLPLAWPERHPAPVPKAMRVAALACARGSGATFMFGMSRLAFAGAADLEDPEQYLLGIQETNLTEHETALAAQDKTEWDVELRSLAVQLRELGIARAPALRWHGRLYVGTHAITPVLAQSSSSQPPFDLP